MSDGSSLMSMNTAIWIMVGYVFIYYVLARSVLARINQLDPDYFDTGKEDGYLPIGSNMSSTILEMIFDGNLPGREYGQFVRTGLYVVRGMFACYVPLFGFVLYLAWQ
jgi:hypothetical protein